LPADLVAVEDCFGVFGHFLGMGARDNDNAVAVGNDENF